MDTETAINERMRNNPQLNRNRNVQLNRQIVERLTHMLHECQNPFIERFQTAYERLREAAAIDPTVDPMTTMDRGSLPARLVAGRNTRTENVPTTSEIGGVVVDTSYSANVRDIVLRLRAPANGEGNALGLQWISQLHPWYLPLYYVLFFPHGNYCWQQGMLMQNARGRQRNHIEKRMWFRYHLYERPGVYSSLFLGRRLFQQFMDDAWATCEQIDLDWHRKN